MLQLFVSNNLNVKENRLKSCTTLFQVELSPDVEREERNISCMGVAFSRGITGNSISP